MGVKNSATQYFLVPCFMAVFAVSSVAQSNLDSLFHLWQDDSRSDSVRAWALYDYISDGPFYDNPDSALVLEKALIQLAQKADLPFLLVDAWKLQGYTFFRKGNYLQALAAYREGLNYAKQYQDTVGIADLLMRTGYIYHDNEDLIIALDYYNQSRDLLEMLNDTSGLSSIYNEFGSIYRVREQYEKSLEYYSKALDFYRQQNEGNNSPALLLNIGELYLDKGDLDQANRYGEMALQIDRERNDVLGIATGLSLLGEVLLRKGEDSAGLDALNQSLQLSLSVENREGALNTLLTLADYYVDEGQFNRAKTYAQRALDLAVYLGDYGGQHAANEQLYLVYKSENDTEKALLYHEAMSRFQDSIQAEASVAKLQQTEFARQIMADSLAQVEKEMKMQLAHAMEIRKKDMNRKIATGVGLFFILLSGGLYNRWRYVRKAKAIIEKEKKRSDELLLNILPYEVAEELKANGQAAAKDFDKVSILFTDFKSFTEKAAQLSATELLAEINHCFEAFDLICEEFQIEKIKTIGDAYMAAGGLPVPSQDAARITVLAALKMQAFIQERYHRRNLSDEIGFEMRVGIHTGPVVAGIVGVKKFQYDVWGDTVNMAARMEGAGEVGKVNISKNTYELLMDDPDFSFVPRGSIKVKGKGSVEMWFVESNEDRK